MPQFGSQRRPRSAVSTNSDYQAQIDIPTPAQKSVPSKKSRPPKSPTSRKLSVLCILLGLTSVVLAVLLILNLNKTPSNQTISPTIESVDLSSISTTTLGFYPDKIVSDAPTSDDDKSYNNPKVSYRLYVSALDEVGNTVLSAYISPDNNDVNLTINWQYATPDYDIPGGRTSPESFTFSFNKPVADLLIGHSDNDFKHDVLLILMADGTVEYMPVYSALYNRSIRSYGQLPNLMNIVKFYQAQAMTIGSNDLTYTLFAQQTDGTIINLSTILLDKLKL